MGYVQDVGGGLRGGWGRGRGEGGEGGGRWGLDYEQDLGKGYEEV